MKNYIPTWLKIGRKNPWIKHAYDPIFDEKIFTECDSVLQLVQKILHGNWCLGQAFYFQNLCLINQINGGDEWLVIRNDLAFESFTCESMGRRKLFITLKRILQASDEALKTFNY